MESYIGVLVQLPEQSSSKVPSASGLPSDDSSVRDEEQGARRTSHFRERPGGWTEGDQDPEGSEGPRVLGGQEAAAAAAVEIPCGSSENRGPVDPSGHSRDQARPDAAATGAPASITQRPRPSPQVRAPLASPTCLKLPSITESGDPQIGAMCQLLCATLSSCLRGTAARPSETHPPPMGRVENALVRSRGRRVSERTASPECGPWQRSAPACPDS